VAWAGLPRNALAQRDRLTTIRAALLLWTAKRFRDAVREKMSEPSLLRNRNFVLLYSGKLVSLLGDQVYLIALSWFVLGVTHSPLASGLLLMSGVLPFVLIGPFTGVLADWFERRIILVAMDGARGALVAGMALLLWLQLIPLWLLFVGSFFLGIFGAVFNPASSAILPNIVPESQFARVSAVDQFVWSGCSLFGMMAGGILFNLFGIVVVFLINAGSYILSGALELCMRLPRRRPDRSTLPIEPRRFLASYFADLGEGFRYLRRHRTILILFGCFAISNFILWPQALIYVPFYFRETLHATAADLSIVIGSAFIGMILGSVLIPRFQKNLRAVLLFGWLAAGFANICFAFPVFPRIVPLLTVRQITAYLFFISIILGLGIASMNIPVTVIVQKRLDDQFRGRVWAFLGSLNSAIMPLAYLCGGFLARSVPLYAIFITGGAILLAVFILLSLVQDLRSA
jgi:DHA3 family macrolide efflux protein-like MFS transporter